MDSRAFQRAFEAYRDPVFRFLLRLTRVRSQAEDLLQDTFVALWRKRVLCPDGPGTLPYVRRIAWHLYLNHRTKTTRRAGLALAFEPAPRETSGSETVATRDEQAYLLRCVQRALDDLQDGQREVFVLHRFEGLSCREIAELMDIPLKTAESRLGRATRAIAERLRCPVRDPLTG